MGFEMSRSKISAMYPFRYNYMMFPLCAWKKRQLQNWVKQSVNFEDKDFNRYHKAIKVDCSSGIDGARE